jgi:hypothetical protein
MVIFHSYVDLPEGIFEKNPRVFANVFLENYGKSPLLIGK